MTDKVHYLLPLDHRARGYGRVNDRGADAHERDFQDPSTLMLAAEIALQDPNANITIIAPDNFAAQEQYNRLPEEIRGQITIEVVQDNGSQSFYSQYDATIRNITTASTRDGARVIAVSPHFDAHSYTQDVTVGATGGPHVVLGNTASASSESLAEKLAKPLLMCGVDTGELQPRSSAGSTTPVDVFQQANATLDKHGRDISCIALVEFAAQRDIIAKIFEDQGVELTPLLNSGAGGRAHTVEVAAYARYVNGESLSSTEQTALDRVKAAGIHLDSVPQMAANYLGSTGMLSQMATALDKQAQEMGYQRSAPREVANEEERKLQYQYTPASATSYTERKRTQETLPSSETEEEKSPGIIDLILGIITKLFIAIGGIFGLNSGEKEEPSTQIETPTEQQAPPRRPQQEQQIVSSPEIQQEGQNLRNNGTILNGNDTVTPPTPVAALDLNNQPSKDGASR